MQFKNCTREDLSLMQVTLGSYYISSLDVVFYVVNTLVSAVDLEAILKCFLSIFHSPVIDILHAM